MSTDTEATRAQAALATVMLAARRAGRVYVSMHGLSRPDFDCYPGDETHLEETGAWFKSVRLADTVELTVLTEEPPARGMGARVEALMEARAIRDDAWEGDEP